MMITIYADDDDQVSVNIDNGDLISQPVLVDYFTLLPTSYTKPSVLRQEVFPLSLFTCLTFTVFTSSLHLAGHQLCQAPWPAYSFRRVSTLFIMLALFSLLILNPPPAVLLLSF